MGCIVGKSRYEPVLTQISEQQARITEYEKALEQLIPTNKTLNFSEHIVQDLRKSMKNLSTLSNYFPIDSHSELESKILAFQSSSESTKSYLTLRLQSSDHEYRISENFSELMERVKQLDIIMSQKINSKAISLDKILTQGNHLTLIPDLQKVKTQQIELSSYRGGNFEEIVLRVSQRYDMDKELEVIQMKLESKLYSDSLNSEDLEGKELMAQMTELRNTRSDLERAWDMVRLNTKNNDDEIKTLRFEHEQLEPVATELEKKVGQLRAAKQDFETRLAAILELQGKLEFLDREIDQVQSDYTNFKDLQEEIEAEKHLKENLHHEIEKLSQTKTLLSDKAKELENIELLQVPTLEPSKSSEDELKNLSSEALLLSEQIREKEQVQNEHIKKFLIMRLKNFILSSMQYFFDTWKHISYKLVVAKTSYLDPINISSLNEEDIPEPIDKETNESNEVLTFVKGTNEKPMSLPNLFKFLEELMDKKVETDEKDIKEGRRPRTMIEFMQEHLSRVFGISKIANRQLAQIIPALKGLFEEKDPYGGLYCRLLGVFDPVPLPLPFAVFLATSRVRFLGLIEKYERSSMIGNNRKSRGKKDIIEDAKSGGWAFATDVIDLTINIFEDYRTLGMLALKMLKPTDVCVEDYVVFQICQKIVRLGRSIESVFNIIDKDASLSVDIKELSQFSKSNIDLWVDENDLELCFSKLVTPGTDEIPKESFISRFSIKTFQELTKNKNYILSKSKFLTTLTEVFNEIQRKQSETIDQVLSQYPNPLSKPQFTSIIKTLEPELAKNTERYFREISEDGETTTRQNVQKLFYKHCLGEHRKGPFAIKVLYEVMEEKKIKTTLDENLIAGRDRSKGSINRFN